VVGNRIKSPVELVVGSVRSLNTPVRDMGVLLQAMDLMGQNLLFPPSVKGWDGGRTWINTSTVFVRQNALNFLLTGRLPGATTGTRRRAVRPDGSADRGRAAVAGRRPERRCSASRWATPTRARTTQAMRTLTGFAREHDNRVNRGVLVGMLLLIAAMPEYQLC
jgi:hypothetical protein